MSEEKLSHSAIVKIVERHLRHRASIVLVEPKTLLVNEEPDVIAWTRARSTLVEVKASRADFGADKKKLFRAHPEQGMGVLRFYACPPGVVRPEDLPPSWGLMLVTRKGVRVEVDARPQAQNQASEIALLVSALERATEGWGQKMFGDERQTTKAHPKIEARKAADERKLAKLRAPDVEGYAKVERGRDADLAKKAAEFDRLCPKIPVRR